MKLLPGVFFLLLFSSLRAQQEKILSKNKSLSNEEIVQLLNANRQPRKAVIPFSTLNNPTALSTVIREKADRQLPVTSQNDIFGRALAEPGCIDSSFVKRTGIVDNALYVNSITHTKDDGILIAGLAFDVTLVHPGWKTNGVLIKTDNMGNILWKKLYKDQQDREKYQISITFVAELQNGDILTVSSLDTAQGSTSADFTHQHTLLTRLTPAGNVLWSKPYNSLNQQDNQFMPFDIRGVAEATNGDMILCGTALHGNGIGMRQTVIRIDNAGNKIWDGEYNAGSEGIQVFLENGKITVVGLTHGVSGQYALVGSLHFMTLEFASGAILNSRSFTPAYNDPVTQYKNFTYYFNHCVKLDNGHYLLWGQTFSGYTQTTDTIDYFAVLEFDAGHTLVDAYTISGPVRSNYYGDYLYFDRTGKGLFRIHNNDNAEDNIFEGSLHNKQLVKERMTTYHNTSLGNNGSFGPNQQFSFFNDGSYLHCTSYFEDFLHANSYFQFKKMHDSDTSSSCMGRDSITVKIVPYLINEDPPALPNPPVFDQIRPTAVQVTYTDDYTYRYKNPCQQKSYCDTLKIHGDSAYCNTEKPVIFTVYKNPLCGSFAEWTIDPSIVSSMTQVNDTSIAVIFKNINWSGKIYASLSTGKCTVPLYDSLSIHITQSVQGISLGADTVICTGNTMTLHAGPGFASYKWQDASADSVFIVVNAGLYHVETEDYCGNIYRDTILVNTASYPFTLGRDTSKCNNDTITLTATPGFINYQWEPAYNINTRSANTADVFPSTNTSYIVTAEKMAGCVVKDTIIVTVLHSPSINLGKDTSFCKGESIILNAGPGFLDYQWSTGAGTQTINPSTAGEYSIKATYSNGCSTYDTLRILQVAPLPDFTLGNSKDTVLCEGQPLNYRFNLPGANYLWNDGSSASDKTIVEPGPVWLKVVQQGCAKTDTINLSFNPAPVIHLGDDTTLCEGVTKLLDASSANNAVYLWQDGSKQPNYTITKPGLYFVTAVENGCKGGDTILISYRPKPLFSLGADEFICIGEQLVLQPDNSSSGSYRWQDGSSQPIFTVKNAGTYFLTETNDCGTHTDSIKIDMGPCTLQLPSAFTPDFNGINDLFRIKYPFAAKEFKLTIFNRSGQKIFETSDMYKGWDGTFNGMEQPVDVYAWTVSVTYTDNKKENKKGLVTLVR